MDISGLRIASVTVRANPDQRLYRGWWRWGPTIEDTAWAIDKVWCVAVRVEFDGSVDEFDRWEFERLLNDARDARIHQAEDDVPRSVTQAVPKPKRRVTLGA